MNNAEAAKNSSREHFITLQGRESMEVHGVTEVISFDEQTVTLNTVCGTMAVEGSSLHIHVLSIEQGIVTMDGRVDSVSYYETENSEKNGKSGFFVKLFK